jgi:hypothetical protein
MIWIARNDTSVSALLTAYVGRATSVFIYNTRLICFPLTKLKKKKKKEKNCKPKCVRAVGVCV